MRVSNNFDKVNDRHSTAYTCDKIDDIYVQNSSLYDKIINGDLIRADYSKHGLKKPKIFNNTTELIPKLKKLLDDDCEIIKDQCFGKLENKYLLLLNNFSLKCRVHFKQDRIFLHQSIFCEYCKILKYLNKHNIKYNVVGDNKLIQIKFYN